MNFFQKLKLNLINPFLFSKYKTINKLAQAELKDIENIIRPIGTFKKKSIFIKEISKRLVKEQNGIVPNDRTYLETLPGVGRKTVNVFLSEYYNISAIAVDTHVERVSKRLGFTPEKYTVQEVEKKLMKLLPKERWIKTHHQFIFFGRYHCKAIKPNCSNCKLQKLCKYYKKLDKN